MRRRTACDWWPRSARTWRRLPKWARPLAALEPLLVLRAEPPPRRCAESPLRPAGSPQARRHWWMATGPRSRELPQLQRVRARQGLVLVVGSRRPSFLAAGTERARLRARWRWGGRPGRRSSRPRRGVGRPGRGSPRPPTRIPGLVDPRAARNRSPGKPPASQTRVAGWLLRRNGGWRVPPVELQAVSLLPGSSREGRPKRAGAPGSRPRPGLRVRRPLRERRPTSLRP